ncbi:MAG TPA: phosphatase PAP2 family protein [Dehalococcoidia bacterium]|nr:phosphatase PAP2 family protein [Dehalococcoidia bacterium]
MAVEQETRGRILVGSLRVSALLLGTALLLLGVRMGIQSHRIESLQLLLVAGLLFVATYSRTSRTNLLLGFYLIVFVLFARLRGIAEDVAVLSPQYEYPAFADSLGGLIHLPSHWLQDLLYSPGRLTPVDAVLVAVYISYFLIPHLVVLWAWKTRTDLFYKMLAAALATLVLGVMVHFLVPTAPPWLASEAGTIDQVRRLVPEFSSLISGDVYKQAATAVDGNQVAAMPSLHAALTVIVAIVAVHYGHVWRYLGIAYVALMCVALVYLGEHYVVDEIAGIALAIGVWALIGRVQSPASEPDESPS